MIGWSTNYSRLREVAKNILGEGEGVGVHLYSFKKVLILFDQGHFGMTIFQRLGGVEIDMAFV